jgi:hypothetical protein
MDGVFYKHVSKINHHCTPTTKTNTGTIEKVPSMGQPYILVVRASMYAHVECA